MTQNESMVSVEAAHASTKADFQAGDLLEDMDVAKVDVGYGDKTFPLGVYGVKVRFHIRIKHSDSDTRT